MLNTAIHFNDVVECPLCRSASIEQLLFLPDYPLTEFLLSDSENRILTLDNSVLYCEKCSHMFLSRQIDPNFLYSSTYRTSSKTDSSYSVLKRLCEKLSLYDVLRNKQQIIDIGANDGTLLHMLLEKHPSKNFFGIDPVWDDATLGDRVKGYRGFFDSDEAADSIPNIFPRLFIATHVLEHISSPVDFLKRIADMLRDEDQLLLVFPSLEGLLFDSRIESIHHQHLHYFSHRSFKSQCDFLSLKIIRSWIDFDHYGAACVLISKHEAYNPVHDEWGRLSSYLGFDEAPTNVALSFVESNNLFQKYINCVNSQLSSHPHVGIGAGALMSPVLFYYLHPWLAFDAVYDDDSSKIGLHFANCPRVIEQTPLTLENRRVVILGSISKLTGRKLFARATSLNAHSIILPVLGA